MSLSSLLALGKTEKPIDNSFTEKPAVFAWTRTQIEIARRHGESPCSEIQHRVQEQLALAQRYEDVHNEEDLEIEAAYKHLEELLERHDLVVAGDIAEAVVFEGCIEEMRARQLRRRSHADSSASSEEGLGSSSTSSSSSSSQASSPPPQKRSKSQEVATATICAEESLPPESESTPGHRETERLLGSLAAKELSRTWTEQKTFTSSCKDQHQVLEVD